MDRGYRPVDFSAHWNATVADYQSLAELSPGSYPEERALVPDTGSLTLRGLPFQVGDGVSPNCFVMPYRATDHSIGPVAIGGHPHGIVVAHTLLGSGIWEGGEVGRVVAEYRFRFDDGEELTVPIRERLEIGNIPLPWGQYPMLAVPDRHDVMEDQHQGQFERAGFRQTEIQPSAPAAYFLWHWRNPRPEHELESATLTAFHEGVLLAGMTTGSVDEDPVRLRTRLTARIRRIGPDGQPATEPLRVEVDRGVATYPAPLPTLALDEDPSGYPGWGTARPSPGAWYVDVAAAPSATITVTSADGAADSFAWDELRRGDGGHGSSFAMDLIDRGRNWMTLTVLDADTGEPVPCRVAIQTSDGVPFAPHGHHSHVYSGLENWNVDVGGDVRLGNVTYAYIDGRAQGWVPRGEVILDIARGFEYEPVRIRTEVLPGQRELTVTIRRWTDMNAQGWYSGDTHVHFVSAQGALREAAGEDLNVVNLLQSQWGHLFTSTEEFTGGPLTSPDGRHVVWVAQENREHILGHLGLLGLTAPVTPWATGGPGEGELGGSLETTESRWADAAHDQGATVVLAHFPTPNAEAPVMVATGRADAIEMYDQLAFEHLEYYRYLGDGYQLPLVAGTDKMASGVPVGMYRTYAQLGDDEFSFDAWTRALRAGRTFITSGPMLSMSVDGQPIGSLLHVEPGHELVVECAAQGILPFQTLQLVSNGVVIDAATSPEPTHHLRLSTRVRVEGPSWLAARCGGLSYQPLRHHDDGRRGIMAHTSPVYVATGPTYDLRNPMTQDYMLGLVKAAREYIRDASPQYPSESVTHHHEYPNHLDFLEEPFLEAERLIASRGGLSRDEGPPPGPAATADPQAPNGQGDGHP